MTNTISTADKLVKVTLGITKLIVGDSRLDAAKDIMDVITNGKALHADLTASERDIATALLARAEKRFKKLAGRPDFPRERLRTAKIHMEQALEHCIPAPDTLAALGLDAKRITEEMIKTAIGAAPEAEFAVYYASGDAEQRFSRRFFVEATEPFLKELLADPEVTVKLAPTLWAELLGVVHTIDTTTRDTKKMVRQLLERSGNTDAARAELKAQVAALEEKHAEDRAAVANLLKILLDQQIEPEHWETALAEAERRAEELLTSDTRIPNDASEREIELTGEARAALQRRDFARAEELRREARDLGRARRRDAVEMPAAQDAAETSEIAATVAAGLDYRRASALYAEAAETPGLSTALQWFYQLRRALVLQHLGRDFSDDAALLEAVELYRNTVFPLAPRDKRADDWASTQNNLGSVLLTLGERRGQANWLVEAVGAFRNSLEVFTCERTPVQWASTQCDLGNALSLIGSRERGTGRLSEAIEAYHRAIAKVDPDEMPLLWGSIKNSLGHVDKCLNHRRADTISMNPR